MICPNCGREIPDGTVCPCTLEAPAPMYSENPALNAIKAIGSSSLFLAMTVLFSVSALLTILSSIGLSDTISSIYYYAYAMGWDMDSILPMLDTMRSTSVFSAILGSIPAILMAVAMWIHFATCKNLQSGNISTAGLTICKVLCYIYMISLCFVAFLIVALCILAIIGVLFGSFTLPTPNGYRSTYSDEEAQLAVVIVLGVFALVFGFILALAIGYQASIIRTINRTKQVAQTGVADDRVSGYFIGMNYFVAVCSLISGVIALFSAPISGAASLAHGAAFLLMSSLLRRYRQGMNQVMFPPVQPLQPPMPYMYAPVPGNQPPVPPQEPPTNNGQPPQA